MKMQIYQTIYKLSSDRTEFDESPKLQPLYIIHNEFVKNIFNSVKHPKMAILRNEGVGFGQFSYDSSFERPFDDNTIFNYCHPYV